MRILFLALSFSLLTVNAQEAPLPAPVEAAPKLFTIDSGTRIPMQMLNSVSTKHAVEGDRVYLETIFPVMANGRIVIPPGSSVAGTVTSFKRPGRVKGKGELYVRFDTLILPNGVSRDFRSRLGSIDGADKQGFDREEGKIKGEGNKSGDAQTVGVGVATGASLGAIVARSAGGAGIGAAAGAAAALTGILMTRGPDVLLAKGSTVELLLDRSLSFEEDDLNFGQNTNYRRGGDSSGPATNKKATGGFGTRRLPIP